MTRHPEGGGGQLEPDLATGLGVAEEGSCEGRALERQAAGQTQRGARARDLGGLRLEETWCDPSHHCRHLALL